jgi:hypothetical protein
MTNPLPYIAAIRKVTILLAGLRGICHHVVHFIDIRAKEQLPESQALPTTEGNVLREMYRVTQQECNTVSGIMS